MKPKRWRVGAFLILFSGLTMLAPAAYADTAVVPPSSLGYVNDAAGLLQEQTISQIVGSSTCLLYTSRCV